MVNIKSNRHSLQLLKEQLKLDDIDIENEMFVKREILYGYTEDQLFCDLMDTEDAYYEEFSFRIREKKDNSQLSFSPNFIIYIYNKQYGMEFESGTNESMGEDLENMVI